MTREILRMEIFNLSLMMKKRRVQKTVLILVLVFLTIKMTKPLQHGY